MAEYIRFRWTSAKAGVTLALLALIAGVAEKAGSHSGTPPVRATEAASFLKLSGLGSTITSNFLKVENKLLKLDSTFLKLDKQFLKFDRTVTHGYLKIADANAKFLKIDATAANASQLGGMTPDAFFQGHGSVVSGAATIPTTGTSTQLLSLPGGIIVVSVAVNADGVQLSVKNSTGALLPAVQDADSTGPRSVSMADGSVTPLPFVPWGNYQADTGQIRLQIMPNGAFSSVVSILIALTPNPTGNGQIEAVAQAFTGGV